MRGLVTAGDHDNLEPSLQKIFNLYNLPIDSGETDPDNYLYPTTPSSTSDEIDAQTFTKAGTGNVTVTPIGVFTNATTPAVRMGFYTPGDRDSGQYLWYVPTDTSQSVNPFYYGTTGFDPGTKEFGLLTQYPNFFNQDGMKRNVYSEQALNKTWDTSSFNHFRVFPFINQNGDTVANSYIVAEEEYTQAYDNNDLIFVVTNVKPVTAATPTMSVENSSSYPDDGSLLFNRIENPDPNFTNIVRDTNSVVVRNTGSAPLTINASESGSDFTITSGGGSSTIAAGATKTIALKFTATSGTAPHTGQLTITSDDTLHPSEAVNLIGLWQNYSEMYPASVDPAKTYTEPSAQTLINSYFGYTSSIPTAAQFKATGARIQAVGDETESSYWQTADTAAAVTVTELATFHNQTYVDANGNNIPTNSYMGWFTQGSTSLSGSTFNILTDKAGEGQMILPAPNSSSPSVGGIPKTITSGHFYPGTSTFGFTVEHQSGATMADSNYGEWSDPSKNINDATTNPNNVPNFGQFLRFYQAYDKNGLIIPNTYFMLHDYDRSTTNSDYNDNIYLITNIQPSNGNGLKSPKTILATQNTNGTATLTFTSPPDGSKIYGFNVYRSTTVDGVYSLLTGTAITARPSNTYTDYTNDDNTTYYYKVLSVGRSGTVSPPVMARV